LKEQLYQILNIIALIAYQLPLAIVLYKKLWKDLPIRMFSFYWSLGGLINLVSSTKWFSSSVVDSCILVFNIIDVPFVVYIFYLNTNVRKLKSIFTVLIPVYFLIELANGIIRGFTEPAFVSFLGIGVLLVIIVVVIEIFYYFQKLDHTPREKAIIFLYLAVLFEYAVYIYYYVYQYILTADETDKQIIYYGSTLIGIIIASIGFLSSHLKKSENNAAPPREHEVLVKIID